MSKDEIIRQVTAIILKHAKPERIYLYGSQASGEAGSASDIDIAFEDKDFHDMGVLHDEVNALKTLIKVDITNLAISEERFRNRVKSTGRVLYSASKKLRAEDALYNFSRALERFKDAAGLREKFAEEGLGDTFCDLMVKRFEFTYEMAWKTIKRYLDATGITALNPRDCFKEAFAQGLISDQNVWLDMIESRNLSSHVYNEEQVKPLLGKIELYHAAFEQLQRDLQEKIKKFDI